MGKRKASSEIPDAPKEAIIHRIPNRLRQWFCHDWRQTATVPIGIVHSFKAPLVQFLKLID